MLRYDAAQTQEIASSVLRAMHNWQSLSHAQFTCFQTYVRFLFDMIVVYVLDVNFKVRESVNIIIMTFILLPSTFPA